MSIFVLPKRGQKAGRKPANGIDSKAKIAITIDSDIANFLNEETNKSKLINELLRKHYKLPDVSRRLKYVVDLLTDGKTSQLTIPKIASILGFSKAGNLERYMNGVEEPDFSFLDRFSEVFGIHPAWLKVWRKGTFCYSRAEQPLCKRLLKTN